MYSPYSPHAAPPSPEPSFDPSRRIYRPLGGLTTAAIAAIVVSVPAQLLAEGLTSAVGPATDDMPIGSALALAGAACTMIVSALAACVIFLCWFYRAASNVRALGQGGLTFTPGWCVGYWFIPILNLYKPLRAMQEIWRASDPETIGEGAGAWMSRPIAGTMSAWWAAWIVSSFLDRVSARLPEAEAGAASGVAVAGTLVAGLAAMFLVPIMRQLSVRQDASWMKVRALRGEDRSYGSYGAYGPPGGYTPHGPYDRGGST